VSEELSHPCLLLPPADTEKQRLRRESWLGEKTESSSGEEQEDFLEEDVSHDKPKASLLTEYSGNILSLFHQQQQ
jgi:hypothetical protein